MCVKSQITRAGDHTPTYRGSLPIARFRPALAVALLVLGGVHITAGASQRMIIQFSRTGGHTPTEQELQLIETVTQSGIKFVRSGSGGMQIIELEQDLDVEQIQLISAKISQLESIKSAAVDRRYRALFVPNDPGFSHQWYLGDETGGINAVNAWDYTTGSSDTVIAVLDTGILPHSDYRNRVLQGYDFISDLFTANDGDGRDPNPADPGDAVTANECDVDNPVEDRPSSWHGTAITGVLAANTNNEIGIAGIDHRTKILPLRVLGRCGGYTSDIVDAIRWAAGLSDPALPGVNPNPAHIINLSLGGIGECTPAEQAAINDAAAAGVLVVAGAGNDGIDVAGFAPANCDNVLTVAASTRQGGETCYTNYGAKIDLSAPGGNRTGVNNCTGGATDAIYTTSNTGVTGAADETYAATVGTSLAAPMVAATAALVRSVNPSLTPADIQSTLETSAREFPSGTGDSYGDCDTERCGHGLLDAHNAILITREDALSIPGDGTIQMAKVEDCILEDFPSIELAVERVSGEGTVSAQLSSHRMSAQPGQDYGAIDQLLVWAPDELGSKYLTIPIYPDNIIEGAEFFSVAITRLSPNAVAGYPASTRVTIVSTDGNVSATCAQPEIPPTPAPPPPSESGGGGTLSLAFLCLQFILLALQRKPAINR
jgi:serine protease